MVRCAQQPKAPMTRSRIQEVSPASPSPIPPKTEARKKKAAHATTPSAPPPLPTTHLSKRQKVDTEPKAKSIPLNLYSPTSAELPKISEIRELHQNAEEVGRKLMDNRIEQQSLSEEIALLREIFESSKPVVDESWLRLSAVRASLMQLIEDADMKENDPLRVFVGKKKYEFMVIVGVAPDGVDINCFGCDKLIVPGSPRLGVSVYVDDVPQLKWYHR